MFKILLLLFVGVVASVPKSNTKEDVRIVGGEDIEITSAPYQVSLVKNGRHSCGGSIIAVDTILTAAHCVINTNPQDYLVRVGSSLYETGGDLYEISDLMWHPNFNYNKLDSDVALLLLSKPLTFKDGVAAINLIDQDEEINDGEITMVSGWGNIREGGGFPTILQMVLVPKINSNVCNKAYSPMYNITSTMLCAGVPEGGKDACQGDSGGPMVHNGRLVGVVSWGLGCARPNYPGVYAKLSVLRGWIDQSTTYLRRKHTFKPFPFLIFNKLFKL